MKKQLFFVLLLCFALAGCGSDRRTENSDEKEMEAAAGYLREQYGILTQETTPKVILDCDMTYLGDDAMCMCILAQADKLGLIELLGVTVTGGNTFVAAGTNAALNQLERIGREDIPVYMGTDVPLLGFRDMEEQEEIVGSINHWGVMYRLDDYVEPEQYHDLGASYERKWGYSQTEPERQSSIEFMIEQVKQYPGEITIISAGAATNIATACLREESFAADTAGIIYMGTALEGQGTYTPYADFNCFYDAEAFQICLSSDFPSQTIVPHDAAQSAVLDKAVFDLMDAKERTAVSEMWLDNQYSLYQRTTNRKDNCADAIAAVVFLNPSVVRKQEQLSVSINTDTADAAYGSAATWKSEGTENDVPCAAFILDLDTNLYWDFVTDLLCQMQYPSPYTYSGSL